MCFGVFIFGNQCDLSVDKLDKRSDRIDPDHPDEFGDRFWVEAVDFGFKKIGQCFCWRNRLPLANGMTRTTTQKQLPLKQVK